MANGNGVTLGQKKVQPLKPGPLGDPDCPHCAALQSLLRSGAVEKHVRYGSDDAQAVIHLQFHLVTFGFKLPASSSHADGVDGGFGTGTVEALKLFLKEAKLDGDGRKLTGPAAQAILTRHKAKAPAKPPVADDPAYWFLDMDKFLAGRGEKNELIHPLYMPPQQPGNEVKFLLGGEEAFAEMADAMEATYASSASRGAFIYLANWWVNHDFDLRRSGGKGVSGTRLKDYLQRASNAGVAVRALFWQRVYPMDALQNEVEKKFINGLSDGVAILDGRVISTTFNKGSHHQKLLFAYDGRTLTAFGGGIDFDYGRVFHFGEPFGADEGKESRTGILLYNKMHPSDQKPMVGDVSTPLVDVHFRLRGPAAYDLLDLFLRRYVDHPEAKDTTILAPHRDAAQPGGVTVRVCATFGDDPSSDVGQLQAFVVPSQDVRDRLMGPTDAGPADRIKVDGEPAVAPTGRQPYSFAPRGRQSGRAQLLYAISAARKFIYFEDQYMVSQEIAEAIRGAISRHGVRVLGVIPHQSVSGDFDVPGAWRVVQAWDPKDEETKLRDVRQGTTHGGVLAATRLSRFIEVIRGRGSNPRDKPFLFCPVRPPRFKGESAYEYIHSKYFVFDDEFCTIGSMNNNRRSTTHDSEVNVGFYQAGDGFPKQGRMRSWARHLNLDLSDQNQRAWLDDPLKAIEELWSKIGTIDVPPDQYGALENAGNELQLPDGQVRLPNVALYDWSKDAHLSDTEFVDTFADPVVRLDIELPRNQQPGPGPRPRPSLPP